MNSTASSRGTRTMDYRQAFGAISDGYEACRAFVVATDPDKKLHIADSLIANPGAQGPDFLGITGAMLLELSLDSTFEADERLELFEEAHGALYDCVDREPTLSHADSIKSAMYLASIGVFKSLVLDIEPSRKILDLSYLETLELGDRLANAEAIAKRATKEANQRVPRIKGAQAELSILTLLKRFEYRELRDGSWVALPSLYSEDNSGSRGEVSSSWDVSGFVMDEETGAYKMTYPIQVKSLRYVRKQKDAQPTRQYSDDIILVEPGVDLAITPANNGRPIETQRTIPPHVILAECTQEHLTGDQKVSDRLSSRTNALLDILG